jgi:hypothetical protein
MKREQHRIEPAISRLRSLHDGDRGVVDVVACGPQAIPALRRLLFEREPSGLYGARCRAVEALAALGGCGVLIEFLETERSSADSIERLGEDAVINAAALALARAHDRHAFDLLLGLARRPALTGIIGALGAFQRVEAIPALIAALEEDGSRLTAESALKKLGRSARTALVQTANLRLPAGPHESKSSARRRRSALRLLREVGTKRSDWPALRALVHDTDPSVAVQACKICLEKASAGEQQGAACRLIALLAEADWILREEIENTLVVHFSSTRKAIEHHLNVPSAFEDREASGHINASLRNVLAQAHAPQTSSSRAVTR